MNWVHPVFERAWKSFYFESPFLRPWKSVKTTTSRQSTWKCLKYSYCGILILYSVWKTPILRLVFWCIVFNNTNTETVVFWYIVFKQHQCWDCGILIQCLNNTCPSLQPCYFGHSLWFGNLSKEEIRNCWNILNVILGYKYCHMQSLMPFGVTNITIWVTIITRIILTGSYLMKEAPKSNKKWNQ